MTPTMKTRIIDGKAAAERIRTATTDAIKARSLSPGLGVVLVGDDPASRLYVGLKEKAAQEAGIRFEKRVFPGEASMREVLDAVESFNARTDIHAILVQLPLPAGFDEDAAIAAMDPDKDVDGFHPENVRDYLDGRGEAPVLARAVLALLDEAGAPTKGTAAVVANSDVFAAPLAEALRRRGLRPETVVDLAVAERVTREADVVVVAIGKPGWLTADRIKPGAVVVDVGTTRVGERIAGDADAASLEGVAAALTPVPGGVGPVTVATLLARVTELCEKKI